MSENSDRPAKVRSRSNSRAHLMKSVNPFINFMHQFRKENSSLLSKDLFRLAGQKWKSMSSEEKTPFVEAANKMKKLKENDPNKPNKKKKSSKKGNKKVKPKGERVPSKGKGKKASVCSRCGHRHGSISASLSRSRRRKHHHHHEKERMWKSHPRDTGTESSNYSEYRTYSSASSISF